jgi:hypothetical protein
MLCPVCRVSMAAEVDEVDFESAPVPQRSLWSLMGQEVADADVGSKRQSPASNTESVDKEAESRPRSLWALMSDPDGVPSEAADAAETSVRGKDAAVAEGAGDDSEDTLEDEYAPPAVGSPPKSDSDDHDSSSESDDSLSDDDEADGWDVDDPVGDLDGLGDLLPQNTDEGSKVLLPPGFRRGQISAGLGAFGVLATGLTLLPAFWMKLPSSIAGLIAITLGYQALGISRRVPRASRPSSAFPMAGMALGAVSIFAGPVFLTQLGESWRRNSESQVIRTRLTEVGTALSGYHDQYEHFPAGGLFVSDEQGIEIGQHGWMTQLLPWIEQSALYSRIDLQKPWDAPENRPPMSVAVSTFLAPGVEYKPTSDGYATTHYAGVGGRVRTRSGLLSIGIFEKNSAIRRTDIADGLANTLVAGEIVTALPAWGAPDNWREAGRGLNRAISGFGNASGTGAHFLMADGSVHFFSNRTSPEALERMSTRDAND